MARKKAKAPAASAPPTAVTPDEFAAFCRDQQARGFLPPFPVPPALPGPWFEALKDLLQRVVGQQGPILIRLP
jgi:hypothetical protein